MLPSLLWLWAMCCMFIEGRLVDPNEYSSPIYKAIYQEFNDIPACFRFLNSTSVIGCQSNLNEGVLTLAPNLERIDQLLSSNEAPVIAVIPSSLITRSVLDRIQSDQMKRIRGVIVPYVNETFVSQARIFTSIFMRPPSNSDENACPYCPSDYRFNPQGNDVITGRYEFPIFGIGPDQFATLDALDKALAHNQQKKDLPLYHAELDAFMYGSVNSTICLRRSLGQTQPMCVPVGGLSIIGSPTPLASFNSDLPLILVSASMDSRSLVPDLAVGAESAISGVITLLAVVDALSQSTVLTTNPLAQVVFTLFSGESWSLTGSSRFFQDLNSFTCLQPENGGCMKPVRQSLDFQKLRLDKIKTMIELGQLASDRTTTNQVFGFSKPQPSGSPDFIADLNTQSSTQDPNAIPPQFRASSLPNTLPPASLSSLLSWRPNTAHLYLSNHDTQFTNPYFHSPWDDGGDASSFTNTSRQICGIASAIARTVHSYASSSAVPAGVVANCTLVRELYECLVRQFGCPLVASLINLNGNATRLSHYAGLYQFDQTNAYTTFLYHFMWTRLSDPSFSGGTCKTTSNCVEKTPGTRCINSVCRKSFVRYHDAYGTGIEWDFDKSGFLVVDSTRPSWVQSNYKFTSLRLYLSDPYADQVIQLVVSCVLSAASVAGIVLGRRWLSVKLKLS